MIIGNGHCTHLLMPRDVQVRQYPIQCRFIHRWYPWFIYGQDKDRKKSCKTHAGRFFVTSDRPTVTVMETSFMQRVYPRHQCRSSCRFPILLYGKISLLVGGFSKRCPSNYRISWLWTTWPRLLPTNTLCGSSGVASRIQHRNPPHHPLLLQRSVRITSWHSQQTITAIVNMPSEHSWTRVIWNKQWMHQSSHPPFMICRNHYRYTRSYMIGCISITESKCNQPDCICCDIHKCPSFVAWIYERTLPAK